MIKVGTLEGVSDKLQSFRKILSAIGTSGKLKIEPTLSGVKKIPINENSDLTLFTPCSIDFEITDTGVDLKFDRRLPIATYRGHGRNVQSVSVTMENISIGVNWSPDLYFEVLS